MRALPVMVRLQLCANVLQRSRHRQVIFIVIIVYAHINGCCQGSVVGQVRHHHFQVGATRPSVRQQIAVACSYYNVLGAELPQGVPCLVGLVHLAVIHVLRADRHGVAFAKSLDKVCSHPRAARGIGHEIKAGRQVAYIGIKCRVIPAGSWFVLNERHVLPAQGGCVRRRGKPQRVER